MFRYAVMTCSFISIMLPVLRLPTWFPGAAFKQASVECLEAGHDVKKIPFEEVRERMVNRTT
jgi:hypothetical protein